MKIKSIKINHLPQPKIYYDVINANPYNNFFIKVKDKFIVSHNCFMDEVDFIRNQDIEKQKEKAEDMMDTALAGMKTRFIYDGKNPTLLILASSKRSDKSFLEEHMKAKMESDPDNVFISEGSIWDVTPFKFSSETFNVAVGNKYLNSKVIPDGEPVIPYIQQGYKIISPPIDFKPDFIRNIDRSLCDYAGIASTELNKYISGDIVNDNINSERQNAFKQDVIEVGNGKDDTLQYYHFFDINRIPKDLINKPLCIHLDMSLGQQNGSQRGDKTGIAGTFIAGKKPSTDDNPSKDLFYKLGFSVAVQAPKGHQVSFEKNRNFIRWLRDQGFRIKEVTADTFQSYDLIQQLQAEGFNCSVLSVDKVDPNDRVCKPYQSFKNALYENRFELYESKKLIEEIIDLERNVNTGKVDHPPNGSKDTVDAVCGSMFTCSKYAEEYAYEYGESLELMFDTNSGDGGYSQATIDFEEEINNLTLGNYGVGPPTSIDYDDDSIDTSWLDATEGMLII